MPNDTTGVGNYLFQHRLDLGLTTVLVVQDPKNVNVGVAHLEWHVVYNVHVMWSGGTPKATLVNGRLDVGPTIKGPPANATIRAMLANPVGPVYNDLADRASKAIQPQEFALRSQSIVPGWFYQ